MNSKTNLRWLIGVGVVAAAVCIGLVLQKPRENEKLGGPEQSAKQTRNLDLAIHVPLTNENVKVWGEWAKQGIDLAAKDVLRENEVQLNLEYSDDKNDAKESQLAASRFVQSGKQIWLAYLSRASTALAPIAKDNGGLLITNTYTPGICEKAPGYVVRIGQNAGSDAIAMAKFCAEDLGKKKLLVFHMETPAAQQTAEVLRSEYVRLGGECLDSVTYEASTTDFRPKLLQVKSQNPGIIYIYGYNEISTIIRVARELEIGAEICTTDVAEVPSFFERAGDAGNGVYYTALPFDPYSSEPRIVAFRKEFEAANNGKIPDVHAATWYDTVRILGKVAQESDGSVTDIRKRLFEVKNYKGITGNITVHADGDVDREIAIKVTRDGRHELWAKKQ